MSRQEHLHPERLHPEDPTRGGRGTRFTPGLARRRRNGRIFQGVCLASIAFSIAVLITLLADIVADGARWLTTDFLSSFPSRLPARAGIKPAVLGTVWIMVLVAMLSFPFGVGAAIYLEEYAPRGRMTKLIQTNIANLAGVPSIVYGILGLAIFVRFFGFGRSILAGSATLALLVLPVVIIAAQEAIRAVPTSLREAAYGVGATRWQVVRHHVLPVAMPGILTGMILSLSRAIGETAPMILIGALAFVAFEPTSPMDLFTVLPIQIFNWTARPQADFHGLAAAAIIVLLVLLLMMNATAILLRNRYTARREQ